MSKLLRKFLALCTVDKESGRKRLEIFTTYRRSCGFLPEIGKKPPPKKIGPAGRFFPPAGEKEGIFPRRYREFTKRALGFLFTLGLPSGKIAETEAICSAFSKGADGYV